MLANTLTPKPLTLLTDFNSWKESVEEYLITKDYDRYVFTADGPLVDELPDGGIPARKTLAELWLLLDPDIQCQVKSFKTGPATLWRELVDRFTASSTRAEVQRANDFLSSDAVVTKLEDVPKFLSQAFAAADALKRSGTEFPCSSLATIMLKRLPEGFERVNEDIRELNTPLSIMKLTRMFYGRYDILKDLPPRNSPAVPALTTPTLTAFVATTQENCPNCKHAHSAPCPNPRRPYGQSLYEYWKANNMSPTADRRYGFENWVSIGCPPKKNVANNRGQNSDGVITAISKLTDRIDNLINKKDHSNYVPASFSSIDCPPMDYFDPDYLLSATTSKSAQHSWIMDSGASNTYTFDESIFIPGTLKNSQGKVTIGDGKALQITGKGDIYVTVARNQLIEQVRLKNVYLVPSLTCQLLSLGTTTERDCYYEGSQEGINVFKREDSRLTLVGKRHRQNGIVELVQNLPENHTALCNSALSTLEEKCLITAKTKSSPQHGSLYYWHLALNHRHPDDIHYMAKHKIVEGLSITDDSWPGCNACNLCKITRTPQATFSEPHNPDSYHFDTIVGDVIGKINLPTINDESYISILMDIRSRYVSLQLLKSCTSEEILGHFNKFVALIERQPDFMKQQGFRKIRCLRTDMASYYTSDMITSALASKGIIHQYSAPYFPEQNGHAERANRTLIEATRTVLNQSSLQPRLWGEVMKSVAHVYNATTHSALNKSTPHESLFGEKPTINLLHPIGSVCFYIEQNTPKFLPKAIQGILIGYNAFSKAYRIWNETDEKILTSYNVKFDKFEEPTVTNSSEPTSQTELYHNSAKSDDLPETSNTAPTHHELYGSESFETPAISPLSPTENESNESDPPADPTTQTSPVSFPEPTEPTRQSLPRLAKQRAIDHLINNRRAAFVAHNTDYLSALENDTLLNFFNHCLHVLSNQDESLETAFDQNRYNITTSDFDKISQHNIESYALHVAQELLNDSPTLSEAVNGPNSSEWLAAIQTELTTLWDAETFEVVPKSSVPSGQRIISAKLHLRVKSDPVRESVQFKARLVVRGFCQVAGIDYKEIYSPVANFKSILMLLTLGASQDLEIHQMDFNAAFLNATIKEDVYVEPVGTYDSRVPPNHVYKLKKTLYGLKQSPREWWLLLEKSLRNVGWIPTLTDNCVFFRSTNGPTEYLAVYVDDVIIMSPSAALVSKAKSELAEMFKSKDLGKLSYILGVKVTRDRQSKTISLDQSALISKYCSRFGITNAASTPGYWKDIPPALLSSAPTFTTTDMQVRLGALLHLSTRTRPDISYEVNRLSRYVSKPTQKSSCELLRIFEYLLHTTNNTLALDGKHDITNITTFTDANWGGKNQGQQTDGKSTSGTITLIGTSPVCWSSRKQNCVSMSTMESELIALSSGCQDSLWARNLLRELIPGKTLSVKILCDNLPTVLQTQNLSNKPIVRHIDLRYHFARDLVDKGIISVDFVPGKQNPADLFTKSLGPSTLASTTALCKVLSPSNKAQAILV